MQNGSVTTPFGRRPMTLALVKAQFKVSEIREGKSADKWKVYRDVCDARTLLGLRDRALAVLNALLSFYPDTQLNHDENLVVFPSNAQLIARANGIAGTTLRENLAVLVDAGLINRNDSPNGKRYVRRSKDGAVETAYGFSLGPMLARSEEFALMAQQVAEDARRLKVVKERTTIARRDVRKLITAAVEDGAAGDWAMIEDAYIAAVTRLRTAKSKEDFEAILDEVSLLREGILNVLECQVFSAESDSNDSDIRCHIQNSKTESISELEPCSETEQSDSTVVNLVRHGETLKTFPFGLVMRACPEITAYAPGGEVRGWRDLMSAAVVVRSTLGVSASAYQDACEVMGAENAAVAMAAILERAGHINSAGGYLRDLTSKTRRGEFSLGPMLMALLKTNSAGRMPV
ncbi:MULTISPECIES: plasmid replication protein RepC [unclassified Rhizobium]|uniref:plasmid replication protein RepC n=1 Tax=unclassified Rhizobium TaxID=2613769 RepID=UPI001ADAC128|nr:MULTISPECIES: plasmid replication protein RepC [unclassified Rhizobium]MBO9101932.1 replication initiation protein RepC [Rhizobium sp. L58/93]MBO9172103.1 replication initiation protein RepC [Rhizobium sp. L245/93]QXZ88320.1 replication initiation protein RepC [Rhizobium sp. K1/93]QXZ94291.1 replication initiation protein RepC [Rhizobium sp. K15/93]QYA05620.1 replication initiation protein RepC [Rhizobium sp. B21/90]